MSRRMWAVLTAVIMTGILVGVVLGAVGQEEEAIREASPATARFIELKFEILTVIEALDPRRADLSHFEVLSLPLVQVRPGESMQSIWSGPRTGDMMEVQIACTPSVSDNSQILLQDLEIKIIPTIWARAHGEAVPVPTRRKMKTTVKVTPGKPLICGGGSAKVQKSDGTFTQVEKWQVTAHWPVTLARP